MSAINWYYLIVFALSFLLTGVFVFQWHRRVDTHLTAIFIIIPLSNLAYHLLYFYHTPESVYLGLKILYSGGCFLPWLITMCMASLCKLKVSRPLRMATFLLQVVMYVFILTIDTGDLFYRGMTLAQVGDAWTMQKVYGPLHTVFYVLTGAYLAVDIVVLLYCVFRRAQVSRRVLLLLFFPVFVTMAGYFGGRFLGIPGLELVPVGYLLSQVVYLLIAHRMALHDVSEMVIESMVQSGDTGFIILDFKQHYLGSNQTAQDILPELRALTVDGSILQSEGLRQLLPAWIDRFRENENDDKTLYPCPAREEGQEDRFYTVDVNYLYDGRRRRGYQIFLEDDTKNQKYIRLLDSYNSELQQEVAAKTARIVAMHDRLILSLATMVESRDNSTGGHIRRTSQGVRILVEEMKRDPAFGLTEDFCRNLIKAAPMHDLGKIAVDDAILRKPDRYTPEEYAVMKHHAPEGARIVHEILKDTDDEDFRRIAENVAHYHHERVDGSGYPEGLRGEEIPLEARIMAVADVYDALVSKRVYKEKMSFAEADRIIREGMGTQFDEKLLPCYLAARPRLEAYYSAE